ncbi:MAG: hypothetical protein M3454_09295 [Actinomycetota bacterium]|nr:hypothetical protein [Actinomycetota bacterium]
MSLSVLYTPLIKGLAGIVALTALLAVAPAGASHGREFAQVADDCNGGSSNATGYASNKRLAVTKSGRQLAIYDPHGSGIHLRWRDPGKAWKNATRGAVSDGNIPMIDGPNDRPATIAVTTASGIQRAWIVWAGYDFARPSAVMMRRLTGLSDARGPHIGPQVILEPQGLGNVRADIAFERPASGPRGVVTWLRKTSDTSYEVITAWLSDLSARPVLTGHTIHYTTTSSKPTGTLVPTSSGVALVARAGSLRMFTHSSTASIDKWGGGTNGVGIASQAKPNAIALPSGEVLAAVESDIKNHVVEVVRFNSTGSSATTSLKTNVGYMDPSLAVTGDGALLAMVRDSDKALLTRRLVGSAWGKDVVELTTEGGGNYAWPNLLKKAGSHVRMLIDAGRCPTSSQKNAVISYSRSL